MTMNKNINSTNSEVMYNKPKVVYAYAVLLDNKIANWKVCGTNYHSEKEIGGYWIFKRLNDYKLEKKCFICRNDDEWNEVFENLAPKWFKNWKHHETFRGMKAY